MIRVMVVDDQNLIRHALQMYLESESDIEVVGHANDGNQALEQIPTLNPDLVLIDLEMPGMDGFTTIKFVSERFPEVKILVLSSHDREEYINKAIAAGAKGYLHKNTPPEELINAVRYIYKGYFQLGPGLAGKVKSFDSSFSSEKLSKLEEKFNQRLQEIERKIESLSPVNKDEILTELKLAKNQVVKSTIQYKKLQQQVSWLFLCVITLVVIAISGMIIFIFIDVLG
jgi:DNA-binding NarL/FixJ family response regulator